MIYAILAMILLTYGVAFYMLRLRIDAVKKGHIKLSQFRLNNGNDVPDKLLQAARNYSNLFEVPVLFYAAATLTIALHLENPALTILSWIFVISRIFHSWIHLNNNNVIHRLKAFMFGNICIVLMWVILVFQYATHQA